MMMFSVNRKKMLTNWFHQSSYVSVIESVYGQCTCNLLFHFQNKPINVEMLASMWLKTVESSI